MPSPKSKGNNSQSLQGQILDVVVTRMAALEAKVEQLELQVAKLQSQLQEKNGSVKTSVSPQSKAIVPNTSNNQKAKSPVKVNVLKENTKPQGVSKKETYDTPTKILTLQQTTDMLIDLTPKREDLQGPTVKHRAFKKANIASSCAFVKVTGPMGACEAGTISIAVDHIAALQLDIDAENASLWLSSSLVKNPVKGTTPKAQVDDLGFLEMGVVFRPTHIAPESLQFGRVVDALLLPLAILDRLDDPNEVPPNLYYMTWKYHSCGADGFEQFQCTQAKFDQKDRIMRLYRHILGHRQTIQVWFITDTEGVEESFECLRARCYREIARNWYPCSGHDGKSEEYCAYMTGKNRKGVTQFLQQSAPTS